jgi:hypothetical protein
MEPLIIHSGGASHEEMLAGVERGGRFVTYRWAVGLLLGSIAQWSKVTWVPPGEDSRRGGWGYTLLSLTLGLLSPLAWPEVWGALRINLGGGADVTEETVAWLEARRLAAERTAHELPEGRSSPGDEPPTEAAAPSVPLVDAAGLAPHVQQARGPLAVLFAAPWSAPSQQAASALLAWADGRDPQPTLLMVDIDAQPALAAEHRVRRIPALLIIQAGLALPLIVEADPQRLIEELEEAVGGG